MNSHFPRRFSRLPRPLLALSLLSVIAVVPASAAPFTWDGSRTSENWDNVGGVQAFLDTNWDQPLSIPGAPDTVTFPGGADDYEVSLHGSRSVQSVTFTGASDYRLYGEPNTQALTLGTGDITTSGTATEHSFSCYITLGGTGNWSVGNPLLTVVGDISGPFGLTKTGSGTLKLIGDDDAQTLSDYIGDLQVSEGTLIATGFGGRIPAASPVRINAGAALRIDGITETIEGIRNSSGALFLDNGATLQLAPTGLRSFPGTITGATNTTFEITEGNVQRLDAASPSFLGTTLINGGTIRLNHTGALQKSTVDIRVNSGLDVNSLNVSLGGIAGTGNLNIGSQALTVGGNNLPTGYSGILSGSGILTKQGTGTLTLSGANTLSGTTSINAGKIALSHVNALQNSTVDIQINGGLKINSLNASLGGLAGSGNLNIGSQTLKAGANNDMTVYSGILSGSGILTKQGAGTLTLSGANTYSGGTTINDGEVQIGDGGTSGSILGDVVVNNDGRLIFQHSDALVFNGGISGTGSVAAFGTNTLTLTGTNTYSGGTAIGSTSVLRVGNGGSAGSIVDDVSNLGSLTFDRSNNIIFDGIVSGIGSLTKQGAGTLTLTGESDYSGGTVVNDGALRISSPGTAGSGPVQVNSGGRLIGTGPVTGDITIADGGAIAPDDGIRGTMIVDGGLNLAGTYQWQVDGGSSDQLQVGGDLEFTGAGTIEISGSPTNDLYVLATYGTLSGPPAVSNPPAGYELVSSLPAGFANTNSVALVKNLTPVITLNGDMEVFLLAGSGAYMELGAIATEELGASVSITIGGDTVDPDIPGTYIVTYNATDASGNMAVQVTRTVVVAPPILYVDATMASSGNGASWGNAFKDLQDALAVAVGIGQQIWVAQGTYYPDDGSGQAENDRDSTFNLIDNVAIYGGFPTGGGDDTFAARDHVANPTILSGDLQEDDATTGNADNAYHVTTTAGSSVTTTALLDGFTVTAGNANGGISLIFYGGAIYNDGGSPTLANCSFSGNSAQYEGGAIYNHDGSPTLTNCSFSGNSSEIGGAIISDGGSLTLTNCSFSGNSARFGGAIWFPRGSLALTNCSFEGNSAEYGGAISEGRSITLTNCSFSGNSADGPGGAIYSSDSTPTVTNCSFSGNSAGLDGGAIYSKNSTPTVTNCSFSGNSTSNFGGAIFIENSTSTLTNCIIWNNRDGSGTGTANSSTFGSGYTYSHCLVQGRNLSSSGSNLDGTIPANDPLFLIPADPTTTPTTAGDLRLSSGSPVLERGLNSAVTAGTDLDGNARIQGCLVDLGAYEHATNIPAYYCTWIAIQFPAETDPDIIGFLADPNGDGVSNGLAFITGYLANAIAHDALGIITDTGGFMSIEFKEMDAAAPLNHSIVASFDLLTWLPVASISPHVTVVANSGPGFTQTIVESDKTQVPHLFLRQTFDAFPAP